MFKMFLWKVLHAAIPVGEILQRRNIQAELLCKRCGKIESILHLFWECNYAKRIWQLAPLINSHLEEDYQSFRNLWSKLSLSIALTPIGISDSPLAVWILWRIWKTQNDLVFNSSAQTESEAMSKAIISAKEWSDAQIKEKERRVVPRCEIISATVDAISVFSDAAWTRETYTAGLACIFQKEKQTIRAHSRIAEWVGSPLMAEAMALYEGLKQAKESGIKRVTCCSDSKILISAINNGEMIPEIYGVLFDVFNILPFFEVVEFQFISRSENAIADGKAKSVLKAFMQTAPVG